MAAEGVIRDQTRDGTAWAQAQGSLVQAPRIEQDPDRHARLARLRRRLPLRLSGTPVRHQNPSAATVRAFRVLGVLPLRRLPPDVAVVKTTHTGQSNDVGVRRRSILRQPT